MTLNYRSQVKGFYHKLITTGSFVRIARCIHCASIFNKEETALPIALLKASLCFTFSHILPGMTPMRFFFSSWLV
jgi:hypothetical protein